MAHNTSAESYVIKEGLKIVEHFFDLPLDYNCPEGRKIKIFARECIPLEKAKSLEEETKLPFLVYLQGGPGFEVPLRGNGGFAAEFYKKGYRILWVDQRGTGLSTPLDPETMVVYGLSTEEKAQHLKFYRADSIGESHLAF